MTVDGSPGKFTKARPPANSDRGLGHIQRRSPASGTARGRIFLDGSGTDISRWGDTRMNLLPPEPAPCADDDRHPAVEMHVILRDRPDGSSTPPAPSSPSGRLMPVVVIGLLLLVRPSR